MLYVCTRWLYTPCEQQGSIPRQLKSSIIIRAGSNRTRTKIQMALVGFHQLPEKIKRHMRACIGAAFSHGTCHCVGEYADAYIHYRCP